MKNITSCKRFFTAFLVCCLTAGMLIGFAGNGKAASAKTGKEVTCVADLSGAAIGVQMGTTGDIYASDYEGDADGTVIDRYNKGADAIQALKKGKIDCVIIDEQPAKAFVEKNPELKILEEEFTVEEYAICIAKENTQLLDDINAALDTFKEDGTLNKIVSNYIGEDDEIGTFAYEKKDVERKNGKLVMATNAAFPPYEYYENNEPTGIDVDLANALADYLGMELEIEDMEFDSIITAVQSGKADIGLAGLTVTEDRLKNINFSQSYTTSKQVIIVVDDTYAAGNNLSLKDKLYQNFIEDARWQYIAKGFANTMIITFFACLIGMVLGFVFAIIRVAHDKNGSMKILNAVTKAYLVIMRGTPVMVQLLIIYYVIFSSVNVNKILVAVIAFGLNSAAYVAEVVRSGIMSIDNGQMEAGRSLGLNFNQTMCHIILPQAFKNVLPALGNEFIALLKETSISGYIGLMDLTRGGDIIRSNTYEAFLPLLAVALVYLVVVMLLTAGVNRLERSLKRSER